MPPKGSKKGAKPAPAKKAEEEPAKVESEVNGETTAEESEKQEEAVAPTLEPEKEEAKEEKPAPATNGTKASKKRKADDTQKEPSKASRRSSRGAPKTSASPAQLINYLLSPSALELCRPDDEAQDISSRGKDIKTYSGSQLSPFEELLCAIVLSRPISHRLGLRTIRTILNDPYNFTTPKAISDASTDKRHQAMFDARTQHKDKTATQIGLVAQVVSEKFASNDTDTSLEAVRKEAGKGWDAERDLLQKEIKGLGKTGLDIFFRRVQWLWEEAYPFVDERTARGVEKLGLPKDAEGLRKAIDENWKEIKKDGLPKDEKQAKRRAFVIVCERATSADLEGKGEALVEAASGS
ncbi:hypothetical protein BDZ85DRAFT_254597 [Elsinoe ampelina]|uniref:Uncharacterized protein n=1 Tax=Elsinoe ampelina TaxID=302913 RepID=A0A6A6GQH2_9PEZI|nr:hypothetical protein BDZ85DRAFT_254597 [Elsinoe ampelina]